MFYLLNTIIFNVLTYIFKFKLVNDRCGSVTLFDSVLDFFKLEKYLKLSNISTF